MSQGTIEAWLRPPIEIWSALTAAGCGLVALIAPWALMMPPDLGLGTATLAFGLAGLRARQAWRVCRYQYGLIRYKVTTIAPGSVDTGFAGMPRGGDTAWMLTGEDVARTVLELLRMRDDAHLSRIEMRPARPKPRA